MKKTKFNITIALSSTLIFLGMIFSSCEEEHNVTPKPYGYLRIDLPEHEYLELKDSCPYSFEIPVYTEIEKKYDSATYCHKNIAFKGFNATLHLSYFKINDNLSEYLEFSRNLAYQHQVKADAITDSIFLLPEYKVYGTTHDIEGDAASPYQFYLTDSTNHFLRGSLYFNSTPNYDSVQLSLQHLKKDIKHLIETTRWID